jgi:hypothetical protein
VTHRIRNRVSKSGLDPVFIVFEDPDLDWESGSGSRQAELVQKERKKEKNFLFKELSVEGCRLLLEHKTPF